MTDYDDTHENKSPSSGREQRRVTKAPDYVGYTLKDRGEGQDPFWMPIGGAWNHEDGKGMTLQLDAAPLDGRVTLREKRREEYQAERSKPRANANRDHGPDR
ncbi:MAG: hypothetical protein AAF679_14765 [Pseudomonadota bacterium]